MTNITENKTEKKFNIVDDLFGWMSDRENFDLEKMWEHEFAVKTQQGDTVTYGYDSNGFGIKEPGNKSLSFFEALSQSQLINAKTQAQSSENLLNAGAWVFEKLKQPPKDYWQEIGVGMAMLSEGAWQTLNLVTNGGMDKWQSFVEKFTGNDKWGQGGQYLKFDKENNTWNEISSFDYILDNRRKVQGLPFMTAPLIQYGTLGIGMYSQLGKIPQLATWGRIILAELGLEFVATTTREEDTNIADLIGSFGYDEKTSNALRVIFVESLKSNDDDSVFEKKAKNTIANTMTIGIPLGLFLDRLQALKGFYSLSRALKHDKNGRKEFADSLGLTIIKDDGLDGVYKVTNKEGDVIASFDKEELADKLVESLGKEFEVQSFKEGGASVVKPDNINKIDEVIKMRSTTTGEMTVANQKLATKDLEKKLSTDMLKLAGEGAIGKNWYKDSGESILKYVGGDLDKADKFAQLIAIYSPQTNVAVNTQFAIKAWNKFQAGIPIWDGDILRTVTIPEGLKETQKAKFFKELLSEFGGGKKIKGQKSSGLEVIDMGDTAVVVRHGDYDNISAKSRDVKAHLVLTKNQSWGGRKTNAFYNNIIKSIDPNAVEGITADLWMARAFGFYDINVGPVKYDFIEKFVKKVADKKGWSVEQAQASIWVATKARFEAVAFKAKAQALTTGAGKLVDNKFVVVDPKKYFDIQYKLAFGEPLDADKLASSALSFADNLDNNLAQVSWESIPGDFTNHLIELRSASSTMKAQYHTSVASLFVDADGQDILAKELGLLSPGDFEAPGFWMDVSNPSTQSQFATAKLKGTTTGEMDVAGKNLLDVYSSARGLILMQDSVGYTRASIIKTKSKANSMYVKIGRQLTAEETVNLGKAINNSDIGLINGPDGIYIVNFTDDLDNKTFIQNIENIVEKNLDADITIKYAQSDGKLLDIGNNGQDYIKTISDQGRLDILETVASLLKKKRLFDEQFAKQNGYTFDGSTYDNILAEIESAKRKSLNYQTDVSGDLRNTLDRNLFTEHLSLNANDEITIYRAVPVNVKVINDLDFVAFNKEVAERYQKSRVIGSWRNPQEFKIISKKVKVRDLKIQSNDKNKNINEIESAIYQKKVSE